VWHPWWYNSTTILKPPSHSYMHIGTNDPLRPYLKVVMLKSLLSLILVLFLTIYTFHSLGTNEYKLRLPISCLAPLGCHCFQVICNHHLNFNVCTYTSKKENPTLERKKCEVFQHANSLMQEPTKDSHDKKPWMKKWKYEGPLPLIYLVLAQT
jgi:hypothetical protein